MYVHQPAVATMRVNVPHVQSRLWWAAILLVITAVSASAAPATPPATVMGPAPARLWREEILSIPAAPGGPLLVVTLVRPDGPGPFPLAVMNHGATAGQTETAARYRDSFATYYFLSRGYAVALPMMRGFAGSEGSLPAHGCDAQTLATDAANDVAHVIGELVRRPDLDPGRIVVAGQSFGGWNTLAVGAAQVSGVRALVNFNGGVNIGTCSRMRNELVSAAGAFGGKTTAPSLWFYGDTDALFPPTTWRAMFANYTGHGGKAEIIDVGSSFTDSHQFLGDPSAAAKWMPQVDALLARVGLPATLLFPDYLPPAYPPPSGFAAVTDVDKVPFLSEQGKESYRKWLAHPTPRVLAISPAGKMTASFGGFDPASSALRNCVGTGGAMCRLYAVDNDVVWRPLPPPPPPSGFAALTDATAVPYLKLANRDLLAKFLVRPSPRALVISKSGGVFGAYGNHAWEQAWVNCTALAKECEPYIVDDAVVWKAGLYADVPGPQFHTTLRNPAEPPFRVGADHSTVAMAGLRATDETTARKLGDTLLSLPVISALYENTPQGALAVVRHRPSGLVCRDPRLIVFSPTANEPEFAPAPVADCVSRVSGMQSDLSVTRPPSEIDTALARAAIVARLRIEDKDVVPDPILVPGHINLRGTTTPLYIAVAVGRQGAWIVWEKIRTDVSHAAEANRLADALLGTALADMAR